MIFTPAVCPREGCGKPAVCVTEQVLGHALLLYAIVDGSYEYAGETKMLWETQGPWRVGLDVGKPEHELWCENGHDWNATLEDGE